jgi:hypothetical protein
MSLYEKKRARTAIPHFDKVVHCHYAIFPFFYINLKRNKIRLCLILFIDLFVTLAY